MNLSEYFELATSDFRRRQEESRDRASMSLHLAGDIEIEICFADASHLQYFKPGLEHLCIVRARKPALTIYVWDSVGRPPDFNPYSKWGDSGIPIYREKHLRVRCEVEPARLMAVDCASNMALFWMNDFAELPSYERARPFIDIFHWWLRDKQHFLVHAAAVGTEDGCVLLVGPGGSGKSTTAINCLKGGLKYAGDDFCLVGKRDNKPTVFSLYNSAKLECDQKLAWLPEFDDCAEDFDPAAGEKATFFLYPRRKDQLIQQMPIRAILLPRITGKSATALRRAEHNETIQALVPSVVEVLKGCDVTDFFGLFGITKQIPAYILELGCDFDRMPDIIRGLLRTLQPANQAIVAAEAVL